MKYVSHIYVTLPEKPLTKSEQIETELEWAAAA